MEPERDGRRRPERYPTDTTDTTEPERESRSDRSDLAATSADDDEEVAARDSFLARGAKDLGAGMLQRGWYALTADDGAKVGKQMLERWLLTPRGIYRLHALAEDVADAAHLRTLEKMTESLKAQ